MTMPARPIVLGVVGLAFAACAASSAAQPATGGSVTGAGGSTGTAGSAGAAPACQVNVLPISPASFDGLLAGPSSVMRVRGEVTGAVPPLFDWSWTVSLADGSPVSVSSVGSDPSLVEFTMGSIGTYSIAVALTGTSCGGLRTITAAKPGGRIATFKLRVTPPTSEQLPAQTLERQVIGGTPTGGNVLALDPGIVVSIAVVRAQGGDALPSYVRITDAVSGAVLETHTSSDGPSTLRVAQGMYRTLIVPDGDVAPLTLPARSAADLSAGATPLDDGTMIAGAVTDDSGAPVLGATVVLRAGELVSTTGTTDATGAFHVRARPGTFGVAVASTLAAGRLEATLAAQGGLGGLVVADATPPPALAIKLQPGPLVTGTVALSAKDAQSLTADTRITLAAMAPLADVATLAVGAGAPSVLTGDVRFSLHAAADGTLTTGGVPRGVYSLTVFPANADTSDAVTTAMLDLSAGNGAKAVSLAQKVMLKGKLLPTDVAAGVRLVALDDGGLPIVSEGDAGPDGLFQMAVSPMRSYALRALPRPFQALARASFPVVPVQDVDYTVPDRSMPAALLYAGRVVDPGLQGVGAALVQAFCATATAGCTDTTTPIAETVTLSDGTFQLMLPDPDGTP
jgi:hypothetical protein